MPGGRMGSFGEAGAEVGACIAIDGIKMGTGGGARFGVGGMLLGSSTVSVWVDADATSGLESKDIGL